MHVHPHPLLWISMAPYLAGEGGRKRGGGGRGDEEDKQLAEVTVRQGNLSDDTASVQMDGRHSPTRRCRSAEMTGRWVGFYCSVPSKPTNPAAVCTTTTYVPHAGMKRAHS